MFLLKRGTVDMAWFQRICCSIFTKLFFVSLLTWFLIIVAVVVTFFVSRHNQGRPFYNNISLYVEYIIKDIGTPPDVEKAKAISKRTGIHIAYSKDETHWTTHTTFPDLSSIRFEPVACDSRAAIGEKFGRHTLRVTTDYGVFYLQFMKNSNEQEHTFFHIVLLTLISLTLLGCHFVLKQILHPIKLLKNGVKQVADGNLDHQVTTKGCDELAELTKSFNEMTWKLKKIMTAKEHLLRDISHELRSPLTRMKLALEMMGDQELKKDVTQDIIEMESMITTILNTAKDHHVTIEHDQKSCDIGALLQSIAIRYTNSAPGVLFTPLNPPILSVIHESSMRTVFTNLIENGLKFSSKQNIPVMIKINTHTDCYSITIKDYGCGIEEEHLPFIFEPFYRADQSRSRKTGGFGLGLSLCKAIIEAHNGNIKVHSIQDVGTEIVVTLPVKTGLQ